MLYRHLFNARDPRSRSLLLIFTIVVTTGVTVAANVLLRNKCVKVEAAHQQSTYLSKGTAALVTVTPRGFEPAQLNLSAAKVFLLVDNRSGLKQLELQLQRKTESGPVAILLKRDAREKGAGQPKIVLPREKPDWRSVIEFSPGAYVLSELAHPDWSCKITITSP